MKRLVMLGVCAAMLSSVAAQGEGALPGEFTINSNGDKVYFSIGNLVYDAGNAVFSFAANQTDYGSYFGWATSGYHDGQDEGNTHYLPGEQTIAYDDSKVSNKTGYGPSLDGQKQRDIRWNRYDGSRYANYDWGEYNPIVNGGNQAGMWRTLTSGEWNYILLHSNPKWVTRNNVVGLELTADDGEHTVFLPAAGYRGLDTKTATTGTPAMHEVGEQCNYWSATAVEDYSLSAMTMNYYHHATEGDKGELVSYNRFNAFSVRLVRNAAAQSWITVSDRVDNTAVLEAHKGTVPTNVHLIRTLYSDGWNTICLPFDMTTEEVSTAFGADCQLYTFANATYMAATNELDLTLVPATAITAGTPYIILPPKDVVNPDFYNRLITLSAGAGETTVTGTSITFNGIVNPYHLPAGEKQYLFVTATDELDWSKVGDTTNMWGMRAYFHVPDLAVNKANAPQARLRIGHFGATAIKAHPCQRTGTITFNNGKLYIYNSGKCTTILGQAL